MTLKERYYEEVLKPKVVELAKACETEGLSFLALCEWEPGEYGRTCLLQPESSFALRLVDVAARATGNIDSLMLALKRHARENGHNSLYLSTCGVSPIPEPVDPTISTLQERVRRLEADLAEADRRAGAAERVNDQLRDSASARSQWLSKAKREAGFDDAISFDVVWRETLAKASSAEPRTEPG
jgi:hypothetical protein